MVYARSLAVPVLDTDDYYYYFRDARLEPVTLQSLWHILTRSFFANYHPITTLTYAFDRAVWGTWVPGFHLTQLFFYVGGVLGVYFLFARILAWPAGALGAAAIYAVHTIHVEAVAWLASRKDVVCLFFYAFSLLAYVRYAGSPQERRGSYALSLALAAAAMMSKGYAVVLPAALLAYDLCFARRVTRRHLIEKLPFLALSAAAIILTALAQDRDSALVHPAMGWDRRVALLGKVLALYVGRSLLPIHLSAFYPVGGEAMVGPLAVVGMALALALAAGFLLLRRRLPAAAFGIALFALPLGTVMNVFFTLRIWITDRYMLFPTIGSCLALVALAGAILPKRRGLAVLALLVIGGYSALTVARIGVWTSHLGFWSDVVRKQFGLHGSGPVAAEELARVPDLQASSAGPIISLARAYTSAGKGDEAERIAALLGRGRGGGDEESELELAAQALDAGRLEEALRRFTPIAEGRGWLAPVAVLYLSVVEERLGHREASRRWRERGIERYHASGQPATDGLLEVGEVEFRAGRFARAVEWYRLAYRESPNEARSAYFLARALAESGELGEAMQLYMRIAKGSLSILPGSPFTIADVYWNMGLIAEKLGRADEAIGYFEEILRRVPDHPQRDLIRARIASVRAARTP